MELQSFIEFRHLLHQYPDLSGKELATRELIRAFLEPFQPDQLLELGETGLLVIYNGKKPGKNILVRAELDALAIEETNQFGYRSKHAGISHKCGHDGHMVILARLAWLLHQQPLEAGTAYLLFQPAEENGMGAKAIMGDPAFNKLKIDQVIALHNIPGYPAGSVLIKENAFTPSVSSIIVRYMGKTSHAAEPENGICPAPAMSSFLTQALAMAIPEKEEKDFFLVSPVYMIMGEKSYGVTAGYGEVHLTIRAWEHPYLKDQSKTMESLAQSIGDKFGLKTKVDWTQEFSANNNAPEVVEQIKSAATELGLSIQHLPHPMKWGEDFGLFTQHFTGAMFGLGTGENGPALHNPDYDFNDDLIEPGSQVFESVVRKFCSG